MFNFRGVGYRSLPQEELGSVSKERGTNSTVRYYRRSQVIWYLALEAIIFLAGFALFEYSRHPGLAFHKSASKDEYFDLYTTNTTESFTDHIEYMLDTPEAEQFWNQVQDNHGIVSVPTDWALEMGFSESAPHPEVEGYSVYQVDVFHSLHCLYRIRTQLVSNETTQLWPSRVSETDDFDQHTLHCIDYIRQQLICNADILLQGTEDFLHYTKNNGHQCRDYGAIMKWVNKFVWLDHHRWLYQHYNLGHNEDPSQDENKKAEHEHGHTQGHDQHN